MSDGREGRLGGSRGSSPPSWWRFLGPLITVVVAVGLELLSRTRYSVSNPGVLYLAAVVASIYLGGMIAGLVSAGLALALGLVFFSIPGPLFTYSGEDFRNILTLVIATPIVVLMVGLLKRRDELRVRQVARAEVLEQYRDMVEELDAIILEREPQRFDITFISRGAEDLLGQPLERWLSLPGLWIDQIHPEDRARVLAAWREAVRHDQSRVLEYRMLTADGRVVWMRDAVRTVRDPRGRKRVRAVVMDVTERKEAEQALRASEGNYRLLMEKASDGILITDFDAKISDVNPSGCEMLGYTRAELVGTNFRRLVLEEDLERLPLRLEELRAGQPVMVERWLRRKDGGLIAVEISAKRLDEKRLQGIYRDVTERKHAEEELRHALSVLNATLDSTGDGILVVDREGRITSFNRRFVEMWNIPEDVVASRDDNRALGFVLDQLKDPRGFLVKVRELYAQTEAESFDILEFKDGRVFERYSKPQRISGESVGRVWNFRDVTERRRAEQALRQSEELLRQSQKMEAIGRLAGGVAHDFNNLLTAILGNSSLILEQLEPDHPQRQSAEEIEKAAERAAALTHQLLAFSRNQMLELKVMDLSRVVRDMHQLLERLIGEDIDLVLAPADPLGRVRVDRGQIEQVIMNLVVNARDAMPEGGKLILETANVEADETFPQPIPGLRPGRYVLLAVSDTGVGMDAETRAHIFEPFFTTKERGKGTGLGLSTVYGIVRQSDGHIWVYSQPGRGSTFKIYLPRVEDEVEREAAEAPLPAAVGGTETVLLVEDEAVVRTLARNTLAQRGYRMLEAENGTQALEISERHRAPIQLLVTDVVMPGMSGRELAERLTEQRPDLHVLFMSGYTDETIAYHGVLGPGVGFLQKPFTLEALARKVRETLDAALSH